MELKYNLALLFLIFFSYSCENRFKIILPEAGNAAEGATPSSDTKADNSSGTSTKEETVYLQAPLKLCIYKGYPNQVNGSNGDVNKAANVLKDFDVFVLRESGWKTGNNSKYGYSEVIGAVKKIKPSARFFGYIDLSTTIRNHSEQELMKQIDAWKGIGADGVFGDDFGSSRGVTRARQNFFIDYAHSLGMGVFANSSQIDDVLGGDDCHLGREFGDYYLFESFFIRNGEYTDLNKLIDRAEKARFYQKKLGVKIAGYAKNLEGQLNENSHKSDQFKMAFYAACMYGLDAFQMFEAVEGGHGNYVYNYPNPIDTLGTKWLEEDIIKVSDNRYQRSTDKYTFFFEGDGKTNGTGGFFIK